ncbi:hypothetical protein Tco_0324303 [Tanacetum coccineum]
MSSPKHSTSDIEDAFSSMNILNYTSVSSDYFPTSSESSSFNSSENSKDNMIPTVFSPFLPRILLKTYELADGRDTARDYGASIGSESVGSTHPFGALVGAARWMGLRVSGKEPPRRDYRRAALGEKSVRLLMRDKIKTQSDATSRSRDVKVRRARKVCVSVGGPAFLPIKLERRATGVATIIDGQFSQRNVFPRSSPARAFAARSAENTVMRRPAIAYRNSPALVALPRQEPEEQSRAR